jgi:transcription-repair coupling factor (superfamily II helicase)
MAAVGFHLYNRLLTKAVEDMKKTGAFGAEKAAAQISLYHPIINVDLPLEVGIPEEYVPDKGMRLRLYRRLADLHDLPEIIALEEEFNDRFGAPPQDVLNLLFQLKVKVLAEKAGLSSIARESKQLALRFPSQADGAEARQFPALGALVRVSKNTIWLYGLDGDDWQEALLETLEALSEQSKVKQAA